MLKTYLDENFVEKGIMSPFAALAVAGITGGFCGAFFSHPFDTAKTKMQASMYEKAEYLTLSSTVSQVRLL